MKKPSSLLHKYLRLFFKATYTKYFLVLVFAGIWMLFFDRYNLISQYKMKNKIEQLRADEAHYQKAITEIDYEQEKIFSDREELERFAREKYKMKKRNEDVYIVVDE